tara:strand:+ start:247 stop:1047 length:801 start_codon:yes stop_codon:yes gene_type:complete
MFWPKPSALHAIHGQACECQSRSATISSMNLILLYADDVWSGSSCFLANGRRTQHIRTVLQAVVGDTLRVGLYGGAQGSARVDVIDDAGVTLSVQLTQSPPPRHRFDIVLALPRPKMLRRILRTVAEFGVSNLHLINSARVDKSYWQSPLLSQVKLNEALIAGMERSQDTIAPVVHCHQRFRPFVEDELLQLCNGRPCWITDKGAATALSQTPARPALVMIGPEGGFVPFEVELATSVVAERVHLGERTLSVDTALPAVLAQGLAL